MPEVTIDEDCDLGCWKNDVRPTGKFPVPIESESSPAKLRAYEALDVGVTGPHNRHAVASLRAGQIVGHGSYASTWLKALANRVPAGV